MSLTKFESHHLNLHIWSYKIYKTALKLELFELASQTQSLTSGALGSDDPTGQQEETGEGLPRCSGELFLTGAEGSGGCVTTVAISELNRVE